MHYYPEGLYVWDTWYLHRHGQTHLFHLQAKRPGSARPEKYQGSIGHAVSDDLLRWKELPLALSRGAIGAYDDGTLFTGYAVEHEGTIYLFYTSNHDTGGRTAQAICLATSKDGINFVKHPANPIIEPDPRWYYSISEPPPPFAHHAHPHIDCRDLAVVKHPSGDGWLGYVVMRRKGEIDAFHSSCIALCHSKDLVQWKVGPPCFTPNRFNCFEVPDVFEIDKKWYMIALTGDMYGQSKLWGDSNVCQATIVAEADKPEGPFQEIMDNLLLAANNFQGFSARTVEINGERLMFYTRGENGVGRLSWPIKLIPQLGGGLLPIYWKGCDPAFKLVKRVLPINLHADEYMILRAIDRLPNSDRTYMISVKVEMKSAKAAGVAISCDATTANVSAYVAMLDAEKGEVMLAKAPEFSIVQHRRWEIKPGGSYHLRLIVVGEMIEIYVDDMLLIQTYDPTLTKGGVALCVKNGSAKFSHIDCRR